MLEEGFWPITYIRARFPPDESPRDHAVVVVEITEGEVKVLDPASGERGLSRDEFLQSWELMRRLAILVE